MLIDTEMNQGFGVGLYFSSERNPGPDACRESQIMYRKTGIFDWLGQTEQFRFERCSEMYWARELHFLCFSQLHELGNHSPTVPTDFRAELLFTFSSPYFSFLFPCDGAIY